MRRLIHPKSAVTGLLTFVSCMTMAASPPGPLRGRQVKSLSGVWKHRSDSSDAGVRDGWFKSIPTESENCRVPDAWVARRASPTAGIDWFWNTVTTPPVWKTAIVRIQMPLAGAETHLYVNGHLAIHSGTASGPLRLDVTSLLEFHGTNLIAIRIAGAPPTAPPAPHASWQPLLEDDPQIIVSDEACIDAVQVESRADGWVVVRVQIVNASDKSGDAQIVAEISPAEDPRRKAASAHQSVVVSPGSNRAEIMLHVKDPHRWAPESPFEYRVAVELRQNKDVLDNVIVPFVIPGSDTLRRKSTCLTASVVLE